MVALRIRLAHDFFVDARDAEEHGQIGLLVELLQHVDVSHHERTLGHDARRHRIVHEGFEAPSRQLVLALDGLIRIGRRTDGERTFAVSPELRAQDFGDIHAHLDVAIEVASNVPF